ncbi:MAG TPA: hypothetical protein VK530_13325, partial [Candidatus Acidoferrum sp.]|nr:hypothetical protein [Candidatus Acidoferrum sp.]
MRFLVSLLLLVGAPMLCARLATVRTSAGQEFFGHVRFTKTGIVVVNSAANFVLTIAPTNVA